MWILQSLASLQKKKSSWQSLQLTSIQCFCFHYMQNKTYVTRIVNYIQNQSTFETFKTVLIVIQRLRSEVAHICISCFIVRGLMTLNKTHGKQPNQKLMPPFLNELLKLFRKSGLFLETAALRKALICGGNLWGQSGIKLYQAGPHPSWKRSSLYQEINTK